MSATAADVDAAQERVGRRLDPDDPRRRLQGTGDGIEPGHVDERRAHLPLGEQVLEDVGGAVIDVVRRDDVVARLQALEDRRHRGKAGAERRRRGAALERGKRRLEAVAVRVVVARVDVAVRIAAVGVALESRRQMDRIDDRARRRVDAVPGVDGQRLESVRLRAFHGCSRRYPGCGKLYRRGRRRR
jgi:hypothetical protein